MNGTATAYARGLASSAALAVVSIAFSGALCGPAGGGFTGGTGGPPLLSSAIVQEAVGLDSLFAMSCDSYKLAIFQLDIQLSRGRLSADSLLYALARPHGSCAYPVRLWLSTVRIHALLEAERHTEALRTADSLLIPHAVAMRPEDIATVQYYEGTALWHLGRYREAGLFMKSARRYYRETTDFVKVATINGGLGYYYLAVGDTLSALCALDHALETVTKAGDYLNMVDVRRRILEGLTSIRTNRNPDAVCQAGAPRRAPANDDGHSDFLLIVLIVVVSIGVFLLVWSHR